MVSLHKVAPRVVYLLLLLVAAGTLTYWSHHTFRGNYLLIVCVYVLCAVMLNAVLKAILVVSAPVSKTWKRAFYDLLIIEHRLSHLRFRALGYVVTMASLLVAMAYPATTTEAVAVFLSLLSVWSTASLPVSLTRYRVDCLEAEVKRLRSDAGIQDPPQ